MVPMYDMVGGQSKNPAQRDTEQSPITRTAKRIEHDLGNPQNPVSMGNDVISSSLPEMPKRAQNHFNPNLQDPEHPIFKHTGMSWTPEYLGSVEHASPGHQAALEVFRAAISNEEEKIFAQRYGTHLNPHALAIYGTSGTENNGKELLNTIGFVKNSSDLAQGAGKTITGVYFIEDNGHSVLNALMEAFSFRLDEASLEAFLTELSQHIKPNNTGSEIKITEELAQIFTNIFNQIELNNDLRQNLIALIDKLKGESLSDLICAFQSFSQLMLGYKLYGVEQMPIIITCNLSEALRGIKEDLTIREYSECMSSMYSDVRTNKDERISLFNMIDAQGRDVPIFDTDLDIFEEIIHTEIINDENSVLRPIISSRLTAKNNEKNSKNRLSDDKLNAKIDEELARLSSVLELINSKYGNLRNFLDSKLGDWTYGGISGKGYYALLNLMGRDLPVLVFLDNYEKNGPHLALGNLGVNNPNALDAYFYSPNTRIWAVHRETDPTKGDSNGTIGLAIPSWLALNSVFDDTITTPRLRLLANIIKGSQSMGYGNGMGVVFFSRYGGYFVIELPDPRAFWDAKYADLGLATKDSEFLDKLNQIRKVILASLKDGDFNDQLKQIPGELIEKISNFIASEFRDKFNQIREDILASLKDEDFNDQLKQIPGELIEKISTEILTEIKAIQDNSSDLTSCILKWKEIISGYLSDINNQVGDLVNEIRNASMDKQTKSQNIKTKTILEQIRFILQRLHSYLSYIEILLNVFKPFEES
ncbi:MAG: hypothetical protein KatS3mg085_415 [Candidatus Dojkabacteria bacterium]|nr:MAG: hypothetical protein KatS3mg085_415 [Candidatus Dojkabacteria bacterium]